MMLSRRRQWKWNYLAFEFPLPAYSFLLHPGGSRTIPRGIFLPVVFVSLFFLLSPSYLLTFARGIGAGGTPSLQYLAAALRTAACAAGPRMLESQDLVESERRPVCCL